MCRDVGLDEVQSRRDRGRANTKPFSRPRTDQKAQQQAEQHVHETGAVQQALGVVVPVQKPVTEIERPVIRRIHRRQL